MPRKVKVRRRPPSDERMMRHISDPGVAKSIAFGALLLAAFGVGVVLVIRGMS